ncbi:apoptosis regulatory protein Siva-like [Lucilia sericata]|uniref:apoptosis regulatory protein Siva-like n=1 Tax=Lucilia sericata TaxID=13632 RepID=UPI0018A81548|nr:apoptosis regulatory protein Siva-like [Lucilia sericata]
MQRVSLKRMRSEESPYTLQTKMHVNEKIVDSHDANKMKEIHAKTTKLLFQAARSVSNNNIQPNRNKKTPVSSMVVLFGNGQIEAAKGAEDLEEEFLWVRRKAKCCDRETYVQSDCTNCQKPLCEECGFSCTECGQFICNSCVTVFGSCDADHPICEKCSLFA